MGLLVAAIFVAIIARRVCLQYTVGSVVARTGLALTNVETQTVLTHDFIFDVILPPLLFEAAAGTAQDAPKPTGDLADNIVARAYSKPMAKKAAESITSRSSEPGGS